VGEAAAGGETSRAPHTCVVCRDTTQCSWCRGEGFEVSSAAGMQPCGLCAGTGICAFCPHPVDGPAAANTD